MTFTELNARLNNFLMGWLLVLGLKESSVECATLCVKSEVMLMPTTPGYLIHFSRRKREGKRGDSEGLVRAFGLNLVAFRGHAYGPLRP